VVEAGRAEEETIAVMQPPCWCYQCFTSCQCPLSSAFLLCSAGTGAALLILSAIFSFLYVADFLKLCSPTTLEDLLIRMRNQWVPVALVSPLHCFGWTVAWLGGCLAAKPLPVLLRLRVPVPLIHFTERTCWEDVAAFIQAKLHTQL
jgi:hypothetical protein